MKTPPPAHIQFAILAADTALLTIKDSELFVRLIRVERPPHFPDNEGLPGGLIDPKENAEEAARRTIATKGKIDADKVYFEQLYTFSEVERDPRGRVVAVAYLALVPWEKLSTKERGNSAEAFWKPLAKTRALAYDHDEIVKAALGRLCSRIKYTTIISKLMPSPFTLTELEEAYESILKTDLDKRNFRKKILKLGILKELPEKRSGGRFRPAQLYSFASPKIDELGIM